MAAAPPAHAGGSPVLDASDFPFTFPDYFGEQIDFSHPFDCGDVFGETLFAHQWTDESYMTDSAIQSLDYTQIAMADASPWPAPSAETVVHHPTPLRPPFSTASTYSSLAGAVLCLDDNNQAPSLSLATHSQASSLVIDSGQFGDFLSGPGIERHSQEEGGANASPLAPHADTEPRIVSNLHLPGPAECLDAPLAADEETPFGTVAIKSSPPPPLQPRQRRQRQMTQVYRVPELVLSLPLLSPAYHVDPMSSSSDSRRVRATCKPKPIKRAASSGSRPTVPRAKWNRALEERVFAPFERSGLSAIDRRAIYLSTLEMHIERLHKTMFRHHFYPVNIDKVEQLKQVNPKTGKSIVATLYQEVEDLRAKLLDLKKKNLLLRSRQASPDTLEKIAVSALKS